MLSAAYLFPLFTAVLWGLGPIPAKRGLDHGGGPFLIATVIVLTGNVIFWSAVLVTTSGEPFSRVPAQGVGLFLAAGLIGTVLGRLADYTGVDRVGTSIARAVASTSPLFATVLAFVFLGELITSRQAVGVVIVVAGISVLTFSRGGDVEGWRARDVLFPLAAAIFFAIGYVIRRYGLVTTPATALEGTALNEAAALIGLFAYLIARGGVDTLVAPVKTYSYFLVTGVLSSIGLLSFFVGLNLGRVAIVSSLVGTSPLFTTVFSYVFIRDLERVTRGIAIGAGMVVIGVVLVTLP